MINQPIIEKARNHVKTIFSKNVPNEFEYHNFLHTERVVAALDKLTSEANLDDENKEILTLAAYFHDLGFSENACDHENHSKILAKKFLLENDYPEAKISKVLSCIEATKMEWSGEDKLCNMIKDADLSGLASSEYDEISESLRKEMSFRGETDIDKESWIKQNIEFLKNHNYKTKEGKALFKKGKKKNLKKLKKLNKKAKAESTISTNKGAQTQFKTSLRNHIDLSSIADNKANIMLSVNAVIITVGLPLMIERAATNTQLYVPTFILSMVCLTSMIFATLSTRPIKMSGKTKPEDIKSKKSNLFFFGNYYRMNIDEYENAIKEVVSNDDILDNSITRDLFFLGKSLGRKFDYLRWCYNFFMYGIALSIFSYIITMIFF